MGVLCWNGHLKGQQWGTVRPPWRWRHTSIRNVGIYVPHVVETQKRQSNNQ
jgi:hypothetical protein